MEVLTLSSSCVIERSETYASSTAGHLLDSNFQRFDLLGFGCS